MKNMKGFTLIEVMIASTILLLALLPIASIFPDAYRNVDRSGEQTVALTLAQQRIEWLRNQSYAALTAGTTTELLTVESGVYARATTIQVDTPVAGLKMVAVTVLSPGGQPVKLTSLIARGGL